MDYTKDLCTSGCMEKHFVSKCGCRSIYNLNIINEDYLSQAQYCSHLTENTSYLLSQIHCEFTSANDILQQFYQKCPEDCEYTRYAMMLSQNEWPSKPLHKLFYDKAIKGTSYEKYYAPLYSAIYAHHNTSQCKILKDEMYGIGLVKKNFLILEMQLGSYTFKSFDHRAKLSFSSLLSQLGGALNLWSGITVFL